LTSHPAGSLPVEKEFEMIRALRRLVARWTSDVRRRVRQLELSIDLVERKAEEQRRDEIERWN